MITVKEFARCVRDSGVMSVDQVRAVLRELPTEKQPQDAKALARLLVERGKLTNYQARCLCSGQSKGLVLGDYVVLDKIGEGGMGAVYQARHRRMKRLVALKMLLPRATITEGAVKRFYREVEAVAKLSHPHIVAAYDAGEANGSHYLVMEYVDGQDLFSLLIQEGPLPVELAIDCAVQAARGLQYAHEKGIYHRDIKPANLLLDHEGVVKVLDLGLARIDQSIAADEEGEDRLTQTHQIMGTVDYMAPEQAINTSQADHRADIYSLGCTLYFLLTDKRPYGGKTFMEKVLAHREADIPALRESREDVSVELEATVARMMAKSPEDRYPSMAEVIEALQRCQGEQEPDSVHPPAGSAVPPAPPAGMMTPAGSADPVVVAPPVTAAAAPTVDVRLNTDTRTGIAARATRTRGRKPPWMITVAVSSVAILLLAGALFWLGSMRPGVEKRSGENRPKPVEKAAPQPVTVDLIEKVDLIRDTVQGRWELAEHVLTSPIPPRGLAALGRLGQPQEILDRLQLPIRPPPEYDLVIEAQRLEGRGPLLIGLVAGRQFGVILDFAGISGIEQIDGKPVLNNGSLRRGPVFAAGRPTMVTCKVRRESLQIQCDDQTVIYFDGGFQRTSLPDTWRVPAEDCLIIGSLGSRYRITKMECTYDEQPARPPGE